MGEIGGEVSLGVGYWEAPKVIGMCLCGQRWGLAGFWYSYFVSALSIYPDMLMLHVWLW